LIHFLTVDLEYWYDGLTHGRGTGLDSRLAAGLDPLVALLDEHGVRATFFVLGSLAEREPALVRDLHAAGHEIASHGYVHRFAGEVGRAAFRQDIRRSRDVLGAIIGSSVRGYRAPYFAATAATTWVFDEVAAAGFTYDASVFPAWNPRYGMPDSPIGPHLRATTGGMLWEVPVTVLPVGPVRIPFAGGAYLRILPWAAQRVAWRAAARRGPVTSYVHPWELDPRHPRLRDRSALPTATHYFRLGVTRRRLAALLKRYRFGAIVDVLGLPDVDLGEEAEVVAGEGAGQGAVAHHAG
jgi:polysaccharide deacetylase family protein (PEP-CTERM system associated)